MDDRVHLCPVGTQRLEGLAECGDQRRFRGPKFCLFFGFLWFILKIFMLILWFLSIQGLNILLAWRNALKILAFEGLRFILYFSIFELFLCVCLACTASPRRPWLPRTRRRS